MDNSPLKIKIGHFGRTFALLLNRTLMYQTSHPFIKQSMTDVLNLATQLLEKISPLVFILNRGQFFIDEEPLDPRINIKRIADLFKKNSLQSISFEAGIRESELFIFAELFSSLPQNLGADNLKDTLIRKGVFNIKINHVVFKKVTQDDQIVSKDALKQVTPMMDSEDEQHRKQFMETVLESVLSEEFAKTLSISNLMSSPKDFTQQMIEADLASAPPLDAVSGSNLPGSEDVEGGPEPDTNQNSGTDGNSNADIGPDNGRGDSADSSLAGSSGTTGDKGAGPKGVIETGVTAGTGDGTSGEGSGSENRGSSSGDPSTSPGSGKIDSKNNGRDTESGTLVIDSDDETEAGHKISGRDASKGDRSEKARHYGDTTNFSNKDLSPPRSYTTNAAGGQSVMHGAATSQPGGINVPHASPSPAPPPGEKADTGHGNLLLQQLEIMHVEVEKHLQGQSDVGISDLAQAIFDMKKQLLEGIQTQKALGVAYANEQAILDATNKLSDQVLIELIREEYQAGNITSQRMAYIIRRLIPEARELQRLLPKIKKALLDEGMQGADYMALVHELRNELESEDLVRILQESSENIGIDSRELIEEVKRNPDRAAELIYIASEIRKGSGDEAALSDILVDYVEKIGTQLASEARDGTPEGEAHLKKVITQVESSILKKLGSMNVNSELLSHMEERLNERMESIMNRMRVEWVNIQGGIQQQGKPKILSILQTLEHNVSDDEELSGILKIIRQKVDAGEIEENNFSQISKEIDNQRQIALSLMEDKPIPDGVLTQEDLMFILEKEIARTKRYGTPFSALALAFVSATPKTTPADGAISNEVVLNAALNKMAKTFREVDYLAQVGKNRILALLPMADENNARKALSRVLRILHSKPLKIAGIPVQLRVAGVCSTYESEFKIDVKTFTNTLSNNLADMVARVKNIQVLF